MHFPGHDNNCWRLINIRRRIRDVGWLSGFGVVLVQQTTEKITPCDIDMADRPDWCLIGQRRAQIQGAMRSLAVVMIDEHTGYVIKVTPTQDQKMIQAFVSDGLHPSVPNLISSSS